MGAKIYLFSENEQKSDLNIFGGFAEIFVKDILVGLRP